MLGSTLLNPEISRNILVLEVTYVRVTCKLSRVVPHCVFTTASGVTIRDNRCLRRDNRRATRPCFRKLVSVNES